LLTGTGWITGKENLTARARDGHHYGVEGCNIRRRWEYRGSGVCSVDETVPHFVEKEVLIGFGVTVLAVFGKMEAEGGIAEGTFSTSGNLQGESMSIWLIPVMGFVAVATSFFELVGEDKQIIGPP
jgi:hypothetical protein